MKKYSFLLFLILIMFALLVYVLFFAARKTDLIINTPQELLEER